MIEADERKVKQVVFNLLSNAVKFTPDGGRVDVAARLVDDEVQIAVRDTGIGIAPEDQARVFEEFQQVGAPAAASGEGTGLGLALAQQVRRAARRPIWVESEVGVGSTFTFALPLAVTSGEVGHAADAAAGQSRYAAPASTRAAPCCWSRTTRTPSTCCRCT